MFRLWRARTARTGNPADSPRATKGCGLSRPGRWAPAPVPSRRGTRRARFEAGERQLRIRGRGVLERASRERDLLLGADAFAARLLGHHVGVGVQADGRVVPELRGD